MTCGLPKSVIVLTGASLPDALTSSVSINVTVGEKKPVGDESRRIVTTTRPLIPRTKDFRFIPCLDEISFQLIPETPDQPFRPCGLDCSSASCIFQVRKWVLFHETALNWRPFSPELDCSAFLFQLSGVQPKVVNCGSSMIDRHPPFYSRHGLISLWGESPTPV